MHADPFEADSKPLTPGNPRGFYRNADFDAACAALLGGIRARLGCLLLTGEAGLGKTLLLRRCMAEADDVRFVMLGDAHLEFPDILHYLGAELGLRGDAPDAEARIRLLWETLAADAGRGQTVALLLDDAHHLRAGTLRRLWDFVEASPGEADRRLQVVLAGLPELEDKLHQPELRPLQAAIRVRCRLGRLSAPETGQFIAHHLKAAHHAGGALLSPAAVDRIAHHGQGAPRVIALLCDTVLLFASLQAEREIAPAMVDEAARTCLLGELAEPSESAGLEPPSATPPVKPAVAEVSGRRRASGTLLNGLMLAAITAVAVIWFWPSAQIPAEKPPSHLSSNPREPWADPAEAGPLPLSGSLVSVAAPSPVPEPVPVTDAAASGASAPASRPVSSPAIGDTLLPPASVSTPKPLAVTEAKPAATGSPADRTRSQPSGASQTRSRTMGPQANRIQSQSRVAKSRKSVAVRRVWTRRVPYPWERPTAIGFNQK